MTRNIEIIKKLIDLTKSKKIKWNYLGEADSIYNGLSMYASGFDHDNSFYSEIENNYIVLVAARPISNQLLAERISLHFVPNTFRDIQKIDSSKELLRLHTLVKSNFPNSEEIINHILNM